jgi:hypothetical protein
MSPRVPDPGTTARMCAIAAELAAAGLTARLHQTAGVMDITASLGRPGGRPAEVIVDEDGYVEIRYWNVPGAAPAQVVAVITAALAAITAATSGEPARAAGSPGRWPARLMAGPARSRGWAAPAGSLMTCT